MKRELIQKEGYVIRLSPYKEADMMVTCFGPEGLFSFLARGIRKLTSKNAASCRPLTYSHFSLSVSSTGGNLTLVEGQPEKAMIEKDDLLWMSSLSFFTEINSRLLTEVDAKTIYPYFDKAVDLLLTGYSIHSAALLYFAKLLTLLGYGLEVDHCVLCGKKTDIVGVSFEEGGFICQDCESETSEKIGVRNLKILRYGFRFPLNDFGRVSFEKEESLFLIERLSRYAEDLTGVKLKSVSMLSRC